MAGLSSEYGPNRVDGLLWRLTDFERTLGLISRRVGWSFELPIGADAFTDIEDSELDEHVREILRVNPEAGIFCNVPINSSTMVPVVVYCFFFPFFFQDFI